MTASAGVAGKIGGKIKEIRERYGYSQERFAELLGINRSSLSQIETGRTKTSVDLLVKISTMFDVSVDSLLGIEELPEVNLEKEKPKRARKVRPKIRISVPQKHVEKFKQVLLYILTKVGSKPNVGQTVVYKLLYFIDFNFYEKYEVQLTGATYQKNHYGPTPIEFAEIVKEMIQEESIEEVKSVFFKYPQTKYIPLIKPDISKLNAREVEMIDEVLGRLSDMSAKQISEYSHNDVPWLTTPDGGIIDYESVFYRMPVYSVRLDE